MIAATIQYTRFRPNRSANLPNTKAPRKAAASIVLFSSASRPALRFHSCLIRVEAIPMTNRS